MKELIIKLHPTQYAVGFEQVREKVEKIKDLSRKELDNYLLLHTVPVVKGPDNTYYLIDHHHLCCAAFDSGIDKVHIQIVDDWTSFSSDMFWEKMLESGRVWLFDEVGHQMELHDFVKNLPRTINYLKDDPYRSMAGIIRKMGAYEKDWTPFSEFHVANQLRSRINLCNRKAFSQENIQACIEIVSNDQKKNILPN